MAKSGNNDHLTKRGGGASTNSGAASMKIPELAQRDKSPSSGARMREPIGPASASNYGSGASGAHGYKSGKK